MAEQINNNTPLRFALLAALPLIVVGLALWTLSPEGPRGVQANSTPVNPEAVSMDFPFTNNTGLPASDLHVTFSGPVEKPAVTTQPEACDADPSGPPDIVHEDNFVQAFWSIKCIDPLAGPEGTVTIKVFSKDPVEPVSVTWTKDGSPLATITQTVEVTTTPSPSPSASPSPSPTLETPTATPETPTNTPVTPTNTTPPTNTPARPTSTYTNTPPPTNTPGTPMPQKRCGDVNLDQNITSVDATLVLQFVAGLTNSVPNMRNADVNADGAITSIDAVLMLQFTAGLLSQLNCPPVG